jgi:NADH-quinone oxidoreductase subunit J
VLTMLSLGALYMVGQAPFLGFTQIIVYTGAIMMLFVFVLMMVGRDASDSVVEVLRGQRLAAAVLGVGLAGLTVAAVGNTLVGGPAVGLPVPTPGSGNVGSLGILIFQRYLLPFELTSALLITAALGAMVYTWAGRAKQIPASQRQRVTSRLLGPPELLSSRSGPGVFATADSVATPALLPDGSVAPESLSRLIEATRRERLDADVADVSATPGAGVDAHTLRGPDRPRGNGGDTGTDDGTHDGTDAGTDAGTDTDAGTRAQEGATR